MVTTVASVCAIALNLWVGLGWGDAMHSLSATSHFISCTAENPGHVSLF